MVAGLPHGGAVNDAEWYSDELCVVADAVPDQQLAAARDVPARLVVDVATTAAATVYVIVTPLSTMGYTSVASVFNSRQWCY